MRRLVLLAGVLVALVAFNSAAAQNAVTVQLATQNASGVSGTATLTPMGNQTQVVINVTGEPAGASEPAHIHVGACPNPGSVKYPLSNVVNGTSTTTVNASLSSITAGNMAINLHESQQNISHYVACGNIPVVAMAATTPSTGGVPLPAALALAALLGGSGYVLRRKLD